LPEVGVDSPKEFIMRKDMSRWMGAVAVCGLMCTGASAEGLRSNLVDWDRVQGRVTLTTLSPMRTDAGFDGGGTRVGSVGLMGDYFLGNSNLDTASSGLRATSGFWLGSRTVPGWTGNGLTLNNQRGLTYPLNDPLNESSTTPYLGVGYSSSTKGWGVTADFGLMALNPRSAGRLGGVFNGTQTLDDTLRDMRWAPLLQLGVSYSF
jgi:hypothetical protein